ncbi:inositol monophosphatase [Buchnera aphidicola (Pemphigus obesinymphae)]|uniref:inositol monophosphatase family protein n=1 Tax=Buchnera aphidicola TaxID=9 RepID=UPI002237DA25|nr:inositol monophosphatase family protein [Buchnera aphidicola]MCW5196695.1 inositol monophosphatase [Buchnera aphidicola (Pemphigus obesinymphae)]
MYPMLNIAVRAARKGGSIIIQKYDTQKNFVANKKNHKENTMSKIVQTTHKIMTDIIYKAYPNHFICTTKYNNSFKENHVTWIINPLDGLNNFEKKFPHFCLSISIIIKNKTVISVIYDPLKNELFTAIRGQGAQLNGYRMRCSDVNSLSNSKIGMNFFMKEQNEKKNYFKTIELLLSKSIRFISSGSSVLDLAYLAAGRLDGVCNFSFKPRNIISGELQIRESGGIVSELTGKCFNYFNSTSLVSGNSKFLRALLSEIRKKDNI